MNTDSQIFEPLQEAIAERLRSFGPLKGIEVVTQRQGNLEVAMQEANEMGTAIAVHPLVGSTDSPNMPGPYFDQVFITVTVSENPNLSEQKSAVYAAEQALRALHHWQPPVEAAQLITVAPGINPTPVPNLDKNILDANFRTSFGLTPATT